MHECCICFESKPINNCCYKDHVRHIPCTCNVYTHYSCLKKADTVNCIICKKKYKIKWQKNNCELFSQIKKINKFEFDSDGNFFKRKIVPILYALFTTLIFFFMCFLFLIISGYTFNIIYCIFYDGKYQCKLVSLDQPILYICGAIVSPFLFCCCNCCLITCKCFNNFENSFKVFPLYDDIA